MSKENQMDDLMLPTPWVFPYPDREMYSKEQMREYAKKAVEAERHRCSKLAIRCSWEVVGAENALLVEALDEAIRNPPLD